MMSLRNAWVAALASLSVSVSLATDLPADSLYQLHVDVNAQSGRRVGLNLYRGHPVVVSMFYGSCPAACPMLITSIQVYESHLDEAAQARLRVLLVSFDAQRDSPDQLDRLARLHRADPARWTFTSASEADARKIAALLGVRYSRLPDGSFAHALLITLLDSEGRVVARTSTMVGDTQFQARLQAATGPDSK